MVFWPSYFHIGISFTGKIAMHLCIETFPKETKALIQYEDAVLSV